MEKYNELPLSDMIKKWKNLVRPLSIDGLNFIESPRLVVPHKPPTK